jgi:hypothetical protein
MRTGEGVAAPEASEQWLDHFRVSLNRENDLGPCIDAFSSREPVSTSLENALAFH